MDEDFMRMLVCPKCKEPVEQVGDKVVCQNPQCGLRYPIKDGIPVMLIDESEDPQKA